MSSRRITLKLEVLESRDTPSGSYPAVGNPAGMVSATPLVGRNSGDQLALPAGWTQWSNTDADVFAGTAADKPGGDNGGITVTMLTSRLEGRAWQTAARPADVSVSADVMLDTLHPVQILARGKALDTAIPDYYAVQVTRGLSVQLVKVVDGSTTVLADLDSATYFSGEWVRLKLSVRGNQLEASVQREDNGQFLNSAGRWQTEATTALRASDGSITGGGVVGVARPARYAGTVYLADYRVENLTPAPTPPPTPDNNGGGNDDNDDTPPRPGLPSIPRHHDWIRVAALAYSGTPMDSFAQELLRNHLDLVVPNPGLLSTINNITPKTPTLVYSNVTNIYTSLLTDWLAWADRNGVDRESAFFHVSEETAFSGNSPSSQPVNWFWNVLRGPATGSGTWTGLTTPANNRGVGDVSFGNVSQALYLAYPDRFRELNVTLSTAAASGWRGVVEYVSAVDAAGNPTRWSTLDLLSDGSAGFTRSGRLTWDPPSDWKTSVINGSARQFYIRIRATASGTSPVASQVLGRDFVDAGGGTTGTIPAFDHTADRDGDGYLTDAEYARRRNGFDARFEYESRLFQPNYGQMRFTVNPAGSRVADWATDYLKRFLTSQPLADGVFLDNTGGRSPIREVDVLEASSDYAADLAALLRKVNTSIAPKWVLANSAGGYGETDKVFASVAAGMEEFAIRAMRHTFSQFQDLANLVDRRLDAGNYLVLDSLAAGGEATDPRTQLATLAYYYLIADPQQTFLMFYGGNEPSTHWSRHYSKAVEVDIGQPEGEWSVRLVGQDPTNPALTTRVVQREYENGLVLWKGISHTLGKGQGTSADGTATVVQLNGRYRPVRADGTLGAVVTSISMRNAEGAILIRA